MEPMEFVVTMLLANLAAVPMQETGIPLLSGLIPILVVLSMELLLSVLVYHSVGARRLLCGKPVILMENGRLLQENLKKTRITPDELTEFLRIEGITDLASVKYAILETSGQVSVLPYAKFKPASAKAAGVQVEDTSLPVTVISDGQMVRTCIRTESPCTLNAAQHSILANRPLWAARSQPEQTSSSAKDVYLLSCEPGGKLYFCRKERG